MKNKLIEALKNYQKAKKVLGDSIAKLDRAQQEYREATIFYHSFVDEYEKVVEEFYNSLAN